MNRPLLTALAATLLFLSPLSSFAWTSKVVNVADGDTITVLRGTEQTRVRLYGVDTPEAYGTAAKKFTPGPVTGKTVEVEGVDTDHYGRTVGWVTLGPQSLNKELVRNGYAWVYRQYCRDSSRCSDLITPENAAGGQRLGLWQDPPLWEWCRGKRAAAGATVSQPQPKARPQKKPATAAQSSAGFSCGAKRYCKEMTSCAEAMFYLKNCGRSQLDRDGDGVPCEGL